MFNKKKLRETKINFMGRASADTTVRTKKKVNDEEKSPELQIMRNIKCET